MNAPQAPELFLPPGLLLPMADEPTEQYKIENFTLRELEPEDIIDYGIFLVALATFDTNDTSPRKCYMPTRNDWEEMYQEGYGLPYTTFVRKHGGMARLQHNLGFYPHGQSIVEDELVQSLQWVVEDCIPRAADIDADNFTVDEVLRWGAVRRLLPSRRLIYEYYEGDIFNLAFSAGLEVRDQTRLISDFDMFLFGEIVLRDHGKPLGREELNTFYAEYFCTQPIYVIARKFGTLNQFWQNFGYILEGKGLSREMTVAHGVRRQIIDDGEPLSRGRIEQLSKEYRLFSRGTIFKFYDSLEPYLNDVSEAYTAYQTIESEYAEKGIDSAVLQSLASTHFTTDESFKELINEHESILTAISSDKAAFARYILENGFRLDDIEIMKYQLLDLKSVLWGVGIKSDRAVYSFLTFVPRINPVEVFEMMKQTAHEELQERRTLHRFNRV